MVKGDAETCDDEQDGGSATRLLSRKVSSVSVVIIPCKSSGLQGPGSSCSLQLKRRLILNKGLTLSVLITMTPEDYEQFRSDCWPSRQLLTQAVVRQFHLPEGWVVSPENHTEYGGVWPVCLRYIPPHGRHWFMLTSPGDVCDYWMLLLQSSSGQRIKCLRRMPVLDTFLVNSLLLRADVLDKKRYTLAGLVNELAVFTETAEHGRRP